MNTQQRIFLWGGLVVIIGLIVWGIAASGPNSPTANSKTVPGIIEADHLRGPKTAAVALYEYSDFQCPACGAAERTLRQVTQKYGDKIVLVYRQFPLRQVHQNAQLAAQASEAAQLQGKFWEYHDLLFDRQTAWSAAKDVKSVFGDYAKELGLDVSKFSTDLNSQAVKDRIETDVRSGTTAKVPGTPTFFLNEKLITNPGSLDGFSKLIDAALEAGPDTNSGNNTNAGTNNNTNS